MLLHLVESIPNRFYLDESLTWENSLQAGILKDFDTPAIQLLIQGGADLLAKNNAGMTPLLHALHLE